MVYFVEAATANGPPDYTGMIIMLIASMITVLTMIKIPDANLADREYGIKKD